MADRLSPTPQRNRMATSRHRLQSERKQDECDRQADQSPDQREPLDGDDIGTVVPNAAAEEDAAKGEIESTERRSMSCRPRKTAVQRAVMPIQQAGTTTQRAGTVRRGSLCPPAFCRLHLHPGVERRNDKAEQWAEEKGHSYDKASREHRQHRGSKGGEDEHTIDGIDADRSHGRSLRSPFTYCGILI